MAQICAETIGIPSDNVIIDTADTDTGPHCMGTFASRGTHRIGNAIIMAAKEARAVLLDVAADGAGGRRRRSRDRRQGQHPGEGRAGEVDLGVRGGARRAFQARQDHLRPRHVPAAERSYPEPETGKMTPATCYAHACTVAEVEVDNETGEVAVLSLKSAYEVGRALNPRMVEQQIVGGAWMGMSHALYETTEPYYPDRTHGPVDFNEYLMPGPGDLPEFESVDPRAAGRRRPLRRQGRRRDDRQLADPGDRQRHLRRGRRARQFAADHAGEGAARPRRLQANRRTQPNGKRSNAESAVADEAQGRHELRRLPTWR